MDTKTIANEILLGEVARLLAEGRSVTLRAKGNSMNPFIEGGKDLVKLVPADGIKAGDIALAETSAGRYVLHRVVKAEGDSVTLSSVKVRKNVTTPPERYTDATLLSAMEHAGRFVDDDKLKANLGNGLGTPATRADMIEKLVQNRYVEREGKYFVPTAKGREVVRLAPEILRSPELTGVWEGRLERIAKGKEDPELFIKDLQMMASDLVNEVESCD